VSQSPIAFMSYVRSDDQHEGGRLTQFRERLSGEVRMQTGESFEIFQDRNDIAWGQQWKQRIDDSLDAVTFLIPIITPAFFKSPPCREELERFLKREAVLGRGDLILPVYYVEYAILSDEAKREQDSLAKVIAARQFADWRELRFEPLTSPQVGKMLAKMARQIVEALERSQARTSRPGTAAAESVAGGAIQPTDAQAGKAQEDAQPAASGAARGPSPKSEPPTLVVDALHRGDYSTLTEALKEAKPGTRILVRPGLYREGAVIDKPVEIVGDGERGDIVIEASGKNTVLFQANMGRITNLTLRQAGGGKWFCVDIAQGRLDLEECDISSQSLSCVAIHGGADPRLRRNRIHDGKQAGVLVYENGQGTLEDNDIFANALAGVQIKLGGNPTLRRNRIHDGKQVGVFVNKDGQGTLEDNDIFVNAFAGVEIKEGGNPTLRRNRIYENRYSGIRVLEGGGGVFEGNTLRENTEGAWYIAAGAESSVKRTDNIE
jgi:parallel beta-helix repeat protein